MVGFRMLWLGCITWILGSQVSLLPAQALLNQSITISSKDGLPHDDITSLALDSLGFIWIGTERGLSRYDGTSIKNYQYHPDDPTSIPSDIITYLYVGRDGTLWVGTAKGLAAYDRQTDRFILQAWASINKEENVPLIIRSIGEDRQGVIWLGVGPFKGLLRKDPKEETSRFFQFQVETDDATIDITRLNGIKKIQQDPKNDSLIWLATTCGLIRFNKFTDQYDWYFKFDEDKEVQYSFNSFKTMLIHSNGKIYLGSWSGAGYFDPTTEQFGAIRTDETRNRINVSEKAVWAIYPHSPEELWITYSYGLITFNTQKEQIDQVFYNDSENLKIYNATIKDQQNRIWGGSSIGVQLFNPITCQLDFKYYPLAAKELYAGARRLIEDTADQKLYLSVDQGEGIYCLDQRTNKWSVIRPDYSYFEKAAGFRAMDMIRWDENRFLVLEMSQLYTFTKNDLRLRPFPLGVKIDAPFFRRMVKDRSGQLWIGSRRHGLFRIDIEKQTVVNYKEELEADGSTTRFHWIEHLMVDSEGDIWIRTGSGFSIYDFDQGQFIHLPNEEINTPNSFFQVNNFVEDQLGNVWVSGSEEGIGRVLMKEKEKGIVEKIGQAEGLPERFCHYIGKDQAGNIWMVHTKGLSKMDPRQKTFQYFPKGYGLDQKIQQVVQPLSNGQLALGIRRGLAFLEPQQMQLNEELPQPYLTSFKVFDKEFKQDTSLMFLKNLKLSYLQNFFSFEYAAIGYNLPQEVTFAYQLEGVDLDWVYAGKRRYASYTNIPGGAYTFRLMAANNEGNWNPKEYQIRIYITTPWWKQWWFGFAVAGLGAGVIMAIFRWRISQIEQQSKIKADFEKRLGSVEMNALRAQMNPHFIFNVLNAIDYYILKNDTDTASDYLNRFSRLIRLILQNSRSNYVNLKDELEALKLYIEMENLRFEEQFDYRVKIGQGLKIDEIEVPPMLLQPYVENAIWHGLIQKEGKGYLELVITKSDQYLHCVIEDNGIGRAASKALKSKTATRRKSMGMQITQDRIGMINRLYNTNAQIKVLDKVDSEGQALGTRVELAIPIE